MRQRAPVNLGEVIQLLPEQRQFQTVPASGDTRGQGQKLAFRQSGIDLGISWTVSGWVEQVGHIHTEGHGASANGNRIRDPVIMDPVRDRDLWLPRPTYGDQRSRPGTVSSLSHWPGVSKELPARLWWHDVHTGRCRAIRKDYLSRSFRIRTSALFTIPGSRNASTTHQRPSPPMVMVIRNAD